ncbi:UNVERIFIED_ORG: branched-chain amino acid transport system permease protein [Shinella zoogloeoides]|nr:branched-chain amino acid transport system permease protein [Shinella zoogloeoides]
MANIVQVLVDAIALGSLYALVALAIGLVFGVMRLVNFAQADYITIGAYALVVPTASVAPPLLLGTLPSALMIGGVLVVVVALALLTERVAFRPLRNSNPSTLLISSFAVSYFLQNLVMLIHTGRPKSVGIGQGLANAVEIGGVRVPGVQLLTMVVTAGLLIALVLFLKKTPLGVQMRAAAENFQMARLLGMPANRVIALAFAISGLLGGAVSLLLTIQTGTLDLRMGLMPVVYAFFATVIGGMGSLPGAALGGFLVGVASVLLQTYLPADLRPFRDAGVFMMVILILLVRPQGLIVTSAAKERV